MATGYSIEIGTGAELKVLDSNIKFVLDFNLNPTDSGKADSKETFIEAEGSVVLTTASAIADEIVALSQEVTQKVTPRKVVVKQNGVAKWTFEVDESIGTPIVTRFRTSTEQDGSGESFMKWAMTVVVLQPGREGGDPPDDVYEFSTSVETTKVNGKVVKKIWRCSARSKSVGGAEGVVRSFKPSEENVREIVEIFPQDNRATGIWVWEARQTDTVVSITEEITITGSGKDYEEDTQVGEPGAALPPALLHLKPQSVQICTLRGVIIGFESDLQPPPAHFTEGADLVRAGAREQVSFTVILDRLRGLYKREYMEVWIGTNGIPDPDHGDHKEIVLLEPPPDGAAGNP